MIFGYGGAREVRMTDPFSHPRRVEFVDTDMAGIVHFSRFFQWMEQAEHALLRSVEIEVEGAIDGVEYGWPRVHASADYVSPLRFTDEFQVRVTVERMGNTSVTYRHEFIHPTATGEVMVARGKVTAACVRRDDTSMWAAPLPETVRMRLAPFLEG